MNKVKYLRLLIFILPVAVVLLSFVYNDTSYLFLAGITFLLAVFVAIPKLFLGQKFSFKLNKKLLNYKSTKKEARNNKIKNISSFNNKQKNIIYFSLSTLVFIFFFTYVGSHSLKTVNTIHNPILEYYFSQIINLKQTWIYLIGLLVLVALLGSSLKYNSKNGLSYQFNRSQLTKNFITNVGTIFLGFFVSLVALYLYAIFQLNTALVAFNVAPSTVGVVYGKTSINNKLKSMTTSPTVIGSSSNLSNTILSIIINGSSSSNSFYQSVIINAIPHFLILPFNISNQPVYLVHTTLIINSIDKDTMQTISPALAHLFLQNYFKNHVWKSDPNIIILSRQDYLSFRQGEIDSQVQQLENQIQKIDNYIGQVQSDIALSNQKISYNQSGLQVTENDEQSAYNYCVSLGYYDYFTGTFYPTYSQSQCSSQAQSEYSGTIAQFQKNISDWNNELQTDEGYLSDAQKVEQEYKNAIDYVNSQKDTTPDELGKFNEPNTVRVVLDSTSPKGINEFLETLIHENLHYQSSIKNRNFQFSDGSYDGFWEEGLTEYFARKVIFADLGVNVNQGYPLLVKIVAQIAKKIPESTLQQIYFDKDDTTLQAALDKAYGNTFYKDTEPYFEYLSYLPDNLQLKYANNIMTRIGGIRLSSNDLYSTDLQQQ